MTKTLTTMAASLAFMALASHASAATHNNTNSAQLIKQNHKVASVNNVAITKKYVTKKAGNKKSNVIVRNVEFNAPVNTRTIVITSDRASQSTPNLFKVN